MLSVANTTQTDGTGSASGIGAFDGTRESSVAFASKDNDSPNYDVQSKASASAVHLDDHAGTAAFRGTFTSMDASGFTLNMTRADATTRKWPALVIG